MLKKYLFKEAGITLLELLVTLLLVTTLLGTFFGVLSSTFKFNNKTQSHINLRQESNIIITQMRQRHQEKNYSVCHDSLVQNVNISIDKLWINNNFINKGDCISIDSSYDLNIKFTLKDSENNSFDIDTVIQSRKGISSIPIVIEKPISSFYDYLKNNKVFVYGKQFSFSGNNVIGQNATMVILGDIQGNQINGGAYGKVSNIYIDGKGVIDSGQQFGSKDFPGKIFFNGDLTLGSYQTIYGEVFVNGNLKNIGSTINGNIYVNGNVELGWTPTIKGDARIYYTGTLSYPKDGYPESILKKLVHQTTVPLGNQYIARMPSLKSKEWYDKNGYTNEIKPSNMKIFGNNINVKSYYDNNLKKYVDTFNNAIIVSEGDISVRSGDLKMTGVLFAPNGKVTFEGTSFEGLVISKDGFNVVSGGTNLTFNGIENYLKDEKDFPLN
ncbi:hypothetical protein [Bacillus sp. S/N-304-OC-R1]|uniref:hypothetical protein n=1 Tax=Bacillus sp. S/N-304-OC-R1 TaxID=2758034 RepID=UPI001C8D698A|nr:hypothetical protein [Bacillus sp. S/N-304-OC-R1]MBY0123971.1 hypothetical protein [Bacillus sp. S/N-304-OC-R1]